ncbi:hypothetical protein EU805_01860 [Salipiger sp. IMCC34102]|uniref:hypothetical protein n=1 Tax=Salipiger sp. IMCC34102 TaxID=2510647 RepID=UPI00101D12B1|nr:hypothetical protein [Salipiger sp. IMCC34102]RYH04141.1 hypothetical protein EU805_01860 [Salipiger sp. IMCC34102]
MTSASLRTRFLAKAQELMPHMDELQDLPEWATTASHIDEALFRKSEFIGGMAAVIFAVLEKEEA